MGRKLPYCLCGKQLSRIDAKTCSICRNRQGSLNPNYKSGLVQVNCNTCMAKKMIKRKDLKLKHHFCTKNCYRKWLSIRMSNKNNPMFGIRLLGKQSGSYIDGRTPLTSTIRSLKENKDWIKSILERDNYTCHFCLKRGGDLEVDHVKTFKSIFDEFLQQYNMFSPIEDKETLLRLAMHYQPFWMMNNGRTLCKKCHKKKTFTIK